MHQFGSCEEREGVIGDEVVRGKRRGDTRKMKETGVKTTSEGSEGARLRYFGTYHEENGIKFDG